MHINMNCSHFTPIIIWELIKVMKRVKWLDLTKIGIIISFGWHLFGNREYEISFCYIRVQIHKKKLWTIISCHRTSIFKFQEFQRIFGRNTKCFKDIGSLNSKTNVYYKSPGQILEFPTHLSNNKMNTNFKYFRSDSRHCGVLYVT